jgi:uncharacterized membrane protein YqiK
LEISYAYRKHSTQITSVSSKTLNSLHRKTFISSEQTFDNENNDDMKGSSVIVCLAGATAVTAAAVPREQAVRRQEQTDLAAAREKEPTHATSNQEQSIMAAREINCENADATAFVSEAVGKKDGLEKRRGPNSNLKGFPCEAHTYPCLIL